MKELLTVIAFFVGLGLGIQYKSTAVPDKPVKTEAKALKQAYNRGWNACQSQF